MSLLVGAQAIQVCAMVSLLPATNSEEEQNEKLVNYDIFLVVFKSFNSWSHAEDYGQ